MTSSTSATSVDAPFHQQPDLPDLTHLPLDSRVNLPGRVVICPDGPIAPVALTERLPR